MLNIDGKIKYLAMLLIDAVLIITAFALGVYLRFDWLVPAFWINRLENIIIPALLINLSIFMFFGLYKRLWRYASIDDLLPVALAVTTGVAGTFLFSLYAGTLPRSSYIIAWFLMLILIGGFRLGLRLLAGYLSRPGGEGRKKKALIVGAGEAGVMVAREIKRHGASIELRLIGFIDDDQSKQKQLIQGLPVLGKRHDLPEIVNSRAVEELIIAMPSAPYDTLQDIIVQCAELPVKIKTIPGIYEIIKGKVSISALKEVEIEDLLQRAPVDVDLASIAEYLAGQVVLVTGAGGSIGSELCRQIAQINPNKLLLLDHDENGIFFIHLELQANYPDLDIQPLVCDINESEMLKKIFNIYRPEVVFHAAAHKHVPLMEINAEEAIRNNIYGSKLLIDLSADNAVKRFVFVSTDKAVNPTSVMGATKRVVEIYLQQKMQNCNSCVFCAVRFGNVLGSQGSVVMLFRDQIARGGPVTVTHKEMKRYFMTIQEAAQLVIQAGAMGRGGEIFALDMGEPVKVLDLARDMIILSGLKPDKDIKINITGLRPGEKLFEELFSDRENFDVTRHERIFIAPDSVNDKDLILKELHELGKKLTLKPGMIENHIMINPERKG